VAINRREFIAGSVAGAAMLRPAVKTFAETAGAIQVKIDAKLHQIAPPNLNSANEPGKQPVVIINEIEQHGFPETAQAPPVSVSLYEFELG